jgi:hypothetical protein
MLDLADDLPTTNAAWMKWFHDKLTLYKDIDAVKALQAAKGLMQMILLFELDGTILFRGLCSHIKVPKFNLEAKLVFSPAERICTAEDKQTYFNHIAFLVHCGYSLEDLIPEQWKEDNGKWLDLFTKKSYIHKMDDVVNLFLEKQAAIMTTNQRHAFIVLWVFWNFYHRSLIDIHTTKNLIPWSEILQDQSMDQYVDSRV